MIARTPQADAIVCGPRIEAVGLFGESFFAALASGKLKDIVIVQIPSMKTQHCDEDGQSNMKCTKSNISICPTTYPFSESD